MSRNNTNYGGTLLRSVMVQYTDRTIEKLLKNVLLEEETHY